MLPTRFPLVRSLNFKYGGANIGNFMDEMDRGVFENWKSIVDSCHFINLVLRLLEYVRFDHLTCIELLSICRQGPTPVEKDARIQALIIVIHNAHLWKSLYYEMGPSRLLKWKTCIHKRQN